MALTLITAATIKDALMSAPSLVLDNPRNRTTIHSESLRQCGERGFSLAVNRADFSNLIGCEFRHWMRLVLRPFLSALRLHVSSVALFGAKREMGWIHAGRMIATVHDHLGFTWKRSASKPQNNVSRSAKSAVNADVSISRRVFRAGPHPAIIWRGAASLCCHAFGHRTSVAISESVSVRSHACIIPQTWECCA